MFSAYVGTDDLHQSTKLAGRTRSRWINFIPIDVVQTMSLSRIDSELEIELRSQSSKKQRIREN